MIRINFTPDTKVKIVADRINLRHLLDEELVNGYRQDQFDLMRWEDDGGFPVSVQYLQ